MNRARALLGLEPTGYVAHWDQIDFSDTKHPRLTCRVDELRKIEALEE